MLTWHVLIRWSSLEPRRDHTVWLPEYTAETGREFGGMGEGLAVPVRGEHIALNVPENALTQPLHSSQNAVCWHRLGSFLPPTIALPI